MTHSLPICSSSKTSSALLRYSVYKNDSLQGLVGCGVVDDTGVGRQMVKRNKRKSFVSEEYNKVRGIKENLLTWVKDNRRAKLM